MAVKKPYIPTCEDPFRIGRQEAKAMSCNDSISGNTELLRPVEVFTVILKDKNCINQCGTTVLKVSANKLAAFIETVKYNYNIKID